jgi:hypothetical protein
LKQARQNCAQARRKSIQRAKDLASESPPLLSEGCARALVRLLRLPHKKHSARNWRELPKQRQRNAVAVSTANMSEQQAELMPLKRTKKRHVIETRQRVGEFMVTPYPDHIGLAFHFSKVGEYGDEYELLEWFSPIIDKWQRRKRPLVIYNKLTPDSNAAVAVQFGKFKLAAFNIALGEA